MLKHTHDVVREQAMGIGKSIRSLDSIVDGIVDHVETYFARGRRMSGEALIHLVKEVHEKVSVEMKPTRARIDVKKATPARPKGEAFEMLYTVLYPESRIGGHQTRFYRLTSLRVLASRKRVVIEHLPLPLGFKEHAAHRVVGRGNDVNNAVRNLASALVDWAAFPGIVGSAVLEAGYRRLAIPTHHGMMMGCLDADADIPKGARATLGNLGYFRDDIDMAGLAPATYVVNTFIGRNEIHPSQTGASVVLERWRDDCREDFAMDCVDVLWPIRELSAPESSHLSEQDLQTIRSLIVEKRMLKAFGNDVSTWFPVRSVMSMSQDSDGQPNAAEAMPAPAFG